MFSVPPRMAVVPFRSTFCCLQNVLSNLYKDVQVWYYRAFRLYLLVFSAYFPQCFSSRRRLLLLYIVHGWTWFYAATSLTFCQTRYQALYKDVQRLIEDTASIAVRKRSSLYMYASSSYRRNWLWGAYLINISYSLDFSDFFLSVFFQHSNEVYLYQDR